MANRLSKEKANLLASIYCTNGYKKVDAMLEAGYSPSYAKTKCGLKIYDNPLVMQAISRIEASNKAKTDYTIDQYQQELNAAIALATKLNQPSACVSGIVAKGRSMGFDKDNDMSVDRPEPLTSDEIADLKRQAIQLTTTKTA